MPWFALVESRGTDRQNYGLDQIQLVLLICGPQLGFLLAFEWGAPSQFPCF